MAILVIAVAAFDLRYHEFWRDEAQALLLGRDVPLGGLLHALRYEGTPPLFHALLKLTTATLPGPAALTLAGALGYAALIAGTLHLLRTISGRPLASALVTLALACTHTYAYELGVVVRPYGLGLGLCLAAMAELLQALDRRQRKHALRGAILAGLAALTSAHAACLAGAALGSFGLLALSSRARRHLLWPALAALPFFALTWASIAPFPDRTPEGAVAANPHLQNALDLTGKFLENGSLDRGWWAAVTASAAPRWPVSIALAAGIGIIAAIRLVSRRRALHTELFPVGIVALSWATLLYIFVAWYGGGYRHHLLLWIPALVFALGGLLDGRTARGPARAALLLGSLLFLPWIARQYDLLQIDLRADATSALSQTKSAAPLLPAGAHVVSNHDFGVVGLRLYRPDLTLRSPDGRGRTFRFLITDRAWHKRVPLRPLVSDECRSAPDRVFFAALDDIDSDAPPSACLARVQRRGALLRTEAFDLYRVDCACILR